MTYTGYHNILAGDGLLGSAFDRTRFKYACEMGTRVDDGPKKMNNRHGLILYLVLERGEIVSQIQYKPNVGLGDISCVSDVH
jgi:hypothetical protein